MVSVTSCVMADLLLLDTLVHQALRECVFRDHVDILAEADEWLCCYKYALC